MSIGAGCPKFSNLVHDVRRLKKNRICANLRGSSRRRSAMCPAVGRWLFLQRHEDFPVHRADGRRVAQGDVDAAVGEADVVEHDLDFVVAHDVPDFTLDGGEVGLRRFQLRAGGRAHVQSHLPGVHRREKVRPQFREQHAGKRDQREEKPRRQQRATHRPGEVMAVGVAEGVEASLKAIVDRSKRVAAPSALDVVGAVPVPVFFPGTFSAAA